MKNKIIKNTKLLLAPLMMLAYQLTKKQSFLECCLKWDRTYQQALKQNAIINGSKGVDIDQFNQAKTLVSYLGANSADFIKTNLKHAKSQLLQDIAVTFLLKEKKKGYFVEVGVGDGTNISNTFFLEKTLNWKGLLVEPNINFHETIKSDRSALLCKQAAYEKDGLSLQFEAMECGEFSSLAEARDKTQKLKIGDTYKVTTARLDTLLKEAKAPKEIDYISIDTEGSEVSVLNERILETVFDYDYFYANPTLLRSLKRKS